MKKSFFLNSETTKFLVTNNCPGVFGFINFVEKKAWLSYSENLTEAIIRNIKLIDTKQHKIRKTDGWDICVFERSENKAEAKKNFRVYCQNYKDKGLEILNKEFRYQVWGEIGRDFRNKDAFLYYVCMGGKKARGVLAVFEKAEEGELYLKNFKKGKVLDQTQISKRLLIEYKKIDFTHKEYQGLFINEIIP